MSDKFGIAEAANRGIKLGEVGQRIVLENEHVRIWDINLDPGETIDFHVHYHPYVAISLGGGETKSRPFSAIVSRRWKNLARRFSSMKCARSIV